LIQIILCHFDGKVTTNHCSARGSLNIHQQDRDYYHFYLNLFSETSASFQDNAIRICFPNHNFKVSVQKASFHERKEIYIIKYFFMVRINSHHASFATVNINQTFYSSTWFLFYYSFEIFVFFFFILIKFVQNWKTKGNEKKLLESVDLLGSA